jgi:glutamate decarboxylase
MAANRDLAAAAAEDAASLPSSDPPGTPDLSALRRKLAASLSRPPMACDTRTLTPSFLDVEIPAEPVSPETYYEYVAEEIVPYTAPVSSPRCMAHMTSVVPDVIRPIAELTLSLNQNMVKREASGVLTLVERQTIGALHKLVFAASRDFYRGSVQDEESTLGIVTSGGTASNITALWIARNQALRPQHGFAGVEREGVAAALRYYGYSRAVVLGSSLLHYSIDKAVSLLGIGGGNCVKLPIDAARRLDLGALRDALVRSRERHELVIAVVGVAGATDCGSVDSLAEIGHLAREFGVHFHVDAAWGSGLLFSPAHAPKLAGIERADSVTFDTHKQLHLPLASGIVLVRDPRAADVIEKHADYMLQYNSGDLGARALEGSRPCSTLMLHAALHLIGRQGYERMIDEGIRMAQVMSRVIAEHDELELLAEPQTNIVVYRYVPAAWREAAARGELSVEQQDEVGAINCAIQRTQASRGDVASSRTTFLYPGRCGPVPTTALRAVLSNPHTTEADVRRLLQEQVRLAKSFSGRAPPGPGRFGDRNASAAAHTQTSE